MWIEMILFIFTFEALFLVLLVLEIYFGYEKYYNSMIKTSLMARSRSGAKLSSAQT